MTNQIQRKIAIKDFYGKGEHIYEDQMGFDEQQKSQARSLVAREVFRYHVHAGGVSHHDHIVCQFFGLQVDVEYGAVGVDDEFGFRDSHNK